MRVSRSVLLTVAALGLVLVVVTWPLATQMGSAFPGDYGDPVLVTWVMAWVSDHIASGQFAGFWDANIFFPERGTLAFSEHFIAQALMTLPVYLATANPILAYNVAFMLTFVLTGLGMFLLARALTGSDIAAIVAAFVAAFNEYRLVYEVAHLHTLSIHWFPFALYAFTRYMETDKRRYLAAAAAFLILLNLSSIYYMAYCAPFVVVYVVAEAVRWRRWQTPRVWLELWAAAAVVAVAMLPFVLPYFDVQRRLGVERGLAEVILFSARLDHYRVALPAMAAPVIASVVGMFAGLVMPGRRLMTATVCVLLVMAVWLSLGPEPRSGDEALGWPSLYAMLHQHVPGYSALRVPARFATLFFVFLALLAALGVQAVERYSYTAARVAATAVLIVFLLHGVPDAIPLNRSLPAEGLAPAPAYLTPQPSVPPIYKAVASLPAGAVLAELPFGDPSYDVRYMFFSIAHGRRLLNGYSGLFPPSFVARQRVLARPLLDREASTRALGAASHVIVHRQAWTDNTGALIGAWLESEGAQVIAESDGAVLYQMPVYERFAGSHLLPPHAVAGHSADGAQK